MKKLMVMFAAAAVAVGAQAANVSWTISGVTEKGTALTAGHVYMFFAESAASASSQTAALTALAGKGASAVTAGLGDSVWDDTKKATAAGNFSMGKSAALGGYTLPTNADLGLSGDTTYYVYAVVFDTDTISDTSNYIVTNIASGKTRDDASSLATNFNLGSQASATWNAVKTSTDVPEPTSGLLMLIGMAGLALRRKRA